MPSAQPELTNCNISLYILAMDHYLSKGATKVPSLVAVNMHEIKKRIQVQTGTDWLNVDMQKVQKSTGLFCNHLTIQEDRVNKTSTMFINALDPFKEIQNICVGPQYKKSSKILQGALALCNKKIEISHLHHTLCYIFGYTGCNKFTMVSEQYSSYE